MAAEKVAEKVAAERVRQKRWQKKVAAAEIVGKANPRKKEQS